MKILIVEDEHRLSDNIRDYLAPQGYLCEQAFDYNQAKMMSGSYDYDCETEKYLKGEEIWNN